MPSSSKATDSVVEVMPGVAIVANNTWAAFSAKKKLKVTWDETNASKDSWKALTALRRRKPPRAPVAQELKKVGDVDAGLRRRKKPSRPSTPSASSRTPTLEPQNTTAWYQKDPAGDKLEIWGSVQIPDGARTAAASVVGVPARTPRCTRCASVVASAVASMQEYACEAAAISKQAGGIPVKLMWTREDDMTHDFYRAGGFHSFKGAVDDKGKLAAWAGHSSPSPMASRQRRPAAGRQAACRVVPGLANEFPAEYTPNYRQTQSLDADQDSLRPLARAGIEHGGVRWCSRSCMSCRRQPSATTPSS